MLKPQLIFYLLILKLLVFYLNLILLWVDLIEVRNINSSITVWDVYVAINAQYHDYIRLYSEWFRNINKNELDNKIIESAITFYFKDEDSGSTKTWNYFKTAN